MFTNQNAELMLLYKFVLERAWNSNLEKINKQVQCSLKKTAYAKIWKNTLSLTYGVS